MDWLKEFLAKNGCSGALVLLVLILVAQNAGLLGSARQVFGGGAPPAVTADQMERHLEQSKDTYKRLDEIKAQLERNGASNAVGLRILCLQNARTDQQRSDCARIQ